MLAAIRKHKTVVLAIIIAIVIASPAYYFLMPRGTASLPVISATNATTVYNWTEDFSNTSVAWFFLNGTFDTDFTFGYWGYIYANSTLHQKGYPESHVYVNLEAEYSPQSYIFTFGVNITGHTYLSPNPNELNISSHNDLPGYSGLFSGPSYLNNATASVDGSQHALFTLNNGSGLSNITPYRFDVNWSGEGVLYYNLQFSHTYTFTLIVTLEGLYVPVTSKFIINFTDVKS